MWITVQTQASVRGELPVFVFLAPLAEGQRAIVMAWWRRAWVRVCVHASVRSSVRASVNFFFKKLHLRNYWLDFNQISQECSLGGPLSNSFK